MEGRGNIYQSVIFAAQKHLEETGRLPSDPGELARYVEANEDEISSMFSSTEELHEGLVYHAVTLLNDALRQGVIAANTSDPIEQMHSIAHSYLDWAESNPTLFRFLVDGLNGPIRPGGTLHRYASSMRDLYHRKLTEAQRLGILSEDTDIDISTMMLHCLVKGGNMMFLTRSTDPWFDGDTRSTRELAERIFAKFMDNLVRANTPTAKEKA
ncbi:hypothetical protein OC539_00660 [Paracoccus denitrificans]|jgi:hypothetical protein|uniref:Tetracyclin repressor-like C-terminal domain-containing protein n=2 Tax=Paracoccus denitrificans TaxID=266 RepID=A1B998_PARDP|nr:hypothetical protein [Paracoccus denitrificans]ABL72092.1 hypothetical protein Pden_4026 [Paracoccus denitrificans PD1222]MBB4625997.1 hypothetical protein [Paracoccus denitrificans]MCU7426843.1 hypothetical protein [Paracoccus denitrificans]QAR28671.1 hypothetical protein EO213_20500 [Paracoccus denitrificans]UPV96815.1 hypothetical protein M0K93_20590 [Paracoccus denitrificans]